MGFTEGGAPYGLTAEEFEHTVSGPVQQPKIDVPVRANWADAKEALYLLLEREAGRPNADVVGFLRKVGEGFSNRVFGTSIKRASGQEDWVVVKLPSPTAREDRDDHARREVAVLRYLEGQLLPFKVPRLLGGIESPCGLAIVQEWIDGMSVDLKRPAVFGEPPWELVARVAAAIHGLDATPLRGHLPVHAARCDHALAWVARVEGLDEIEAKETSAWAFEHLPPAEPSSLLHGDLLGQNLKRTPNGDDVGVIDWAEAQIGDPAYDLAIVTRCVRKPFGDPHGRQRLVEMYNRCARTPITLFDLHLHELLLAAHWYRDICENHGTGSPHAENMRAAWRSLLKRAPRESDA
jgi:aminoglycoside phosphotransferase (APT) family kinase protein